MKLSRRKFLGLLLAVALAAGIAPGGRVAAETRSTGPADAVVVAVIDFNIVPYHWDFLASRMPQHLDRDPTNNLPLDRAPHTWLPGFPDPGKAFKSYRRFDLTLEEKDPKAPIPSLDARDANKWNKVKASTFKKVNYYWFPGTKVIGAIEFGSQKLHGTTEDHGAGVTSVSVGNLHGTCPECLLLFINLDEGDELSAIRWAMKQSWIDVITNSYGRSQFVVGKTYNGPDERDQRKASERGQTIFFSSGNGIDNQYAVPNATYLSSEKGPDWIVTVGAASPGEDNHYEDPLRTSDHASYLGAGKPVDVASIGLDYPSAYTAMTVGGTGDLGFAGTSNASPTVAGIYARALYVARRKLSGASRIQKNGMVAVGTRYDCGRVRPDCELRDGVLTAEELRTRLLHGAVHTSAGMTTPLGGELPPVGEDELLNEGHGTYFARETGKWSAYMKEFGRVVGPMTGDRKTLKRPDGEHEWMVVDSYCRQHLWGTWTGGYYVPGKTELPGSDPEWPIRSWMETYCPTMRPPP
ncbi:MAG: S8/S53 family peptidase [Actinomycetota bacterium]